MKTNELNLLDEKIESLEQKAENLREKLDTVSGEELVVVDMKLFYVEKDIEKIKEVKIILNSED